MGAEEALLLLLNLVLHLVSLLRLFSQHAQQCINMLLIFVVCALALVLVKFS